MRRGHIPRNQPPVPSCVVLKQDERAAIDLGGLGPQPPQARPCLPPGFLQHVWLSGLWRRPGRATWVESVPRQAVAVQRRKTAEAFLVEEGAGFAKLDH